MRRDGTIERFDDLYSSIQAFTGPSDRTYIGADLNKLYDYVEETLRLFQGYYIPHPLSSLTGYFPFAWYLRDGMKVTSQDTGDVYTISEVAKDSGTGVPTGHVVLKGNDNIAQSTRLLFDRDDELVLMWAFPKTFAKTYSFENGKLPEAEAAPWKDTVTYSVSRQEPGTLSGPPFQGTRDVKPKHRQFTNHPGDDRYGYDIDAQMFDCLVQFDCWAKTNSVAEKLLTWFEGFMGLFTGVFRFNGVKDLYFWARRSDELVTRWRDDIVHRSMTYYVRMESVSAQMQRRITRIFAVIGTMPTGTTEEPSEFDLYGTGWIPDATGIDGVIPVEVHEHYRE